MSLEDDIGRYQSTLKYARSTSDYSVGKGLYMLPSDMLPKPLNQVIEDYNDKIVINTSGFQLEKQKAPKPSPQRQIVETVPRPKRRRIHTLDDHQDEVTSVIFGIGALTLLAIWWIH